MPLKPGKGIRRLGVRIPGNIRMATTPANVPPTRESLRLITPRSDGLLVDACSSCCSHVRLDCGFVDMKGPPRKSYLCTACARLPLGEAHLVQLLADEQQREKDTHGRFLAFERGIADVRRMRARVA